MNKRVLFALLMLLGSSFASVCSNASAPVCATNNQNYANESAAYPFPVIYCGTCAQYQAFKQSWNFDNYTNGTSQLNVTNRSYMERFVSYSFGKMIGQDAQAGQALMAILVGGFFFCFVSFQNIRIEGKMVVLIPAFILAAVFVSWTLSIIALGVGVIFYLALSKLLNK